MKDIKVTFLNNTSVRVRLANNIREYTQPLEYTAGRDSLIQKIAKTILTRKGSNTFNGSTGTGFLTLFSITDKRAIEDAKGSIPIFIDDLIMQIKQEQMALQFSGVILTDSEVLEDIILSSTEFDEVYGGWIINLCVTTKSGIINIKLP